ncbi:alpha/beta fold hydrolase [Bacillus lacus]|uniref:Alpha/beta fold hydrolase n=1 Tax=Metabacillus lacus TaxID=1983721 RepID=A0A7X2J0N3_9BACI|nr:alpha/beta hydrolase [Metabacillus lacus]MRX73104.1 alpha/beta fold hydrolase [Metabacillus lacus]
MPYAETISGRIYYEEHGRGQPLVFIHPPGMGRVVFQKQISLSSQFRVILPDLSGHGDSPAVRGAVTIEKYRREILNLLDELSISKAIICGYSAGGTIAQSLAIQHPARVKALILSGGYPSTENIGLRMEHEIGEHLVNHFRRPLAKGLAAAHTKEKNFRRELAAHMHKADARVWREYYHAAQHYDCRKALVAITCPVLLLYGAKSDVINKHLRIYKKSLKYKQIGIFKDVNHQLPTKKWNEFNQMIAGFLTQYQKTETNDILIH